MVALIVPSYNNLRHLKNLYESIKRHAPECKIQFLDDASTDGTYEWLKEISLKDEMVYEPHSTSIRVGHTQLYDVGISLVKEEVVGILHADMIVGPNYIQNLLKHLKPKTVVCGTRVEPPLHPAGQEKEIMDFGMDFDDLNTKAFDEYVLKQQKINEGKVTYGMFAPWIIYKKDFISMHGHDALFLPFPYEDSDIFQRWMLSNYQLIQSRDAYVYHLTCRGHRWNEQVGKDDDYFKAASHRAGRNYLRKWGSWIQNDEYHHPIITPKYSIGLKLLNCQDLMHIQALEPRFEQIRIDYDCGTYIESEQENTPYDLTEKFKSLDVPLTTEVEVTFDLKKINQDSINALFNIQNYILRKQLESEEPTEFEIGEIKVKINRFDSKLTIIAKIEGGDRYLKYYVNDRLIDCIEPVIQNVF
jgi:glycosyltransferase involved in cell wall biosynthesis